MATSVPGAGGLPSLSATSPDLSPEPQTPCIAFHPPAAPVVVGTLRAAPRSTFPTLGPQAPLHQPWKPLVPWADPSPLHGCTFDVGDWEALQLLRAEARLVVPRAVGLLGVLELAVTSLCVAVVEAAVDGWEDGHLSGGSEPHRAPRQCAREPEGGPAAVPLQDLPAGHSPLPAPGGVLQPEQPTWPLGPQWVGGGHSRQKSGALQSTQMPLSRQALA